MLSCFEAEAPRRAVTAVTLQVLLVGTRGCERWGDYQNCSTGPPLLANPSHTLCLLRNQRAQLLSWYRYLLILEVPERQVVKT